MKIVMMGSYPVYHFADELGFDKKIVKRITSWNKTLTSAISKLNDVDIHFITSRGPLKKTTVINRGKLTVHYIAFPKGINRISNNLYAKWYIHRLLAKLKPDIVHGIGTEHIWPWITVTSPYKSIITIHGIMSELARKNNARLFSQMNYFNKLEKSVLRKSKNIITINPYVDEIIKLKTAAVRYPVENPVDNIFFCTNSKPVHPANILFIGDIRRLKGIHILLEAFWVLKSNEKHSQITLTIVGAIQDIEYYQDLLKFIELKNLNDSVKFTGFLLPDELVAEYQKSIFLVLPSVQETAPMCIAEAMAVGLPVIATRLGGIPNMIENNKDGFLFDENDVRGLKNKMEVLLNRSELRMNMGIAAKAKALKRWKPEIIAAKTVEVYNKVIGIKI